MQAWGWVLEMYGFTLACHIVGIPRVDLFLRMMSQPPWDTQLGPYYILHYTCVLRSGVENLRALCCAWLRVQGAVRAHDEPAAVGRPTAAYCILHYTCALRG